ncbi:MAG: Holliday junction branch migration protein RuvA [Clostridia bacterium]|nr:Holliday junction branch migration protein RuvA [Clostridia bacterium]
MFYYIEGKIIFCEPGTAVIDVGGVAYKMTVSYNTFAAMAGKDKARLYTYLSVSENGIELYGFYSLDELDVYKLLTSISGVGPKAALAILSIMTPAQLEKAVSSDDSRAIAKAQGIGNKTAQLIILKLRDKLQLYRSGDGDTAYNGGANAADALEALAALGYTKADASKIISSMNVSSMTVEDIIREALKRMN